MTNSWNDIKNADVVLIMGGNAAEAHPCGFKWVTEATLRAMTSGTVSGGWAWKHHRKWFRQEVGKP